ncbi:FMN-dependent NADH-azoreductase [Filimonas lacunae]|uniref:FMN dependent NADH:quinone oxidoreductase n=1 Tax=Filimonas lacunae TaxID=477680 RepID=A0A173MBB1_9BACT|nr:FMN-dependent NADH-azoreductase [Filimonas lacunae]BAV04817.1 FMN-dependent NADH-azoreductase [Filimonas lacunae]SIT34720.1 FMN-dependent NADH-azoreductase [Filimonas lacunae]
MKVLSVISSPRGAASNSIKLANAIIEKLQAANPAATVVVKDLTQTPFPHLEESHLNAFFTPAEKHSEENKMAIRHSNEAIQQLMEADVLVIGAPMYNFGISSTLKAWIDHICRAGITFRYTANGPEGLVKGKKVYVAVATGGVYSGDLQAMDFVAPYLKTVLGFIGITDVAFVKAEGFAMSGLQDTALETAINSIVL